MQRIVSVDVYRGLVMLLMMAEVLNLAAVSSALPTNGLWQCLAFHQSHVPWTGLSLHDMIQPSFTFLVGVVLPYSIAGRRTRGASTSGLLLHTAKRSLILILLGIFLRSIHAEQTNFTFEDTLTQIGLGYTFLVLLALCSRRTQLAALVFVLIGYWLAFALYPLPGADIDYTAVGVPSDWTHHFQGFAAHWNKNSNLAWAFDRWFLNLFPRESPFLFNGGGYATLSFIPTLATMILGLFAGNVLRNSSNVRVILTSLLKWGGILLVLGIVFHVLGVNPVVKRIWTPAWVLVSGGLCFGALAFFYWLIDVKGVHRWAFPLTVIGMNSIAAYVIADGGVKTFIGRSLYIHLGPTYDQFMGTAYSTLVSGILILLLEWLILYWMYRQKVFIKI
ncbi:acyltransferase family protein [Parapedobacter sp. DT-150]|uniref:acyltransferase family protein n=1 Tax=Parapedobacter sp. DT-150 TaxID=3396162 RepID=UPI003F198B0D